MNIFICEMSEWVSVTMRHSTYKNDIYAYIILSYNSNQVQHGMEHEKMINIYELMF